jgi:D-alanyl-D-alanine carboxypeptidase (penicillin-binding protein 5/6)
MMSRRWLLLLIAVAMLLTAGFALPDELPFTMQSQSAILLDAATGQVLAEKNADAPYAAAGTMKVMTMLLVFEAIEQGHLGLSDTVSVSPNAASKPGTTALLDAGGTYKAEDLVRAMCMASANDASVALAEALYGSEEMFVAKMNERAVELGCKATQFDNCTGHDSKATTTARDLSIIAAALCAKSIVFSYTSVYMHTLVHNSGRPTELVNPNRLVRFYANCDGLATGSSGSSLYAGAFSAKRGDMRLVAVTLCAPNATARFEDAKALMSYGFANYSSRTIVRKGEILQKNVEVAGGRPNVIDIVCAEDVRLILLRGEEKQLRKELVLSETIEAPVQARQQVGVLRVYLGDELVMEIPAVAAGESRKLSIRELMLLMIRCWLRG